MFKKYSLKLHIIPVADIIDFIHDNLCCAAPGYARFALLFNDCMFPIIYDISVCICEHNVSYIASITEAGLNKPIFFFVDTLLHNALI